MQERYEGILQAIDALAEEVAGAILLTNVHY